MARARSRSRSYSPRPRDRSPPRERKGYDDNRLRERPSSRDHESSGPSGLLIRNLPLDARPNDLRDSFERFGPLKDIYLPRNYYTGEPRGFGFVKYRYAEDAAEAMKRMNHKVIGGREIAIVFAEENRKTPQEMRTTNGTSGRHGDYKRTSHRSPRRRYRSHSRSRSPPRRESRHSKVREDDLYSPRRRSRSISRSPLPRNEREYKSRNCRSPREERVLTPIRSRCLSRSRSRSLSR
ncbi:Serine/arginine-rich SC35-like splicing factor SCL28 [Arabidopsis thaliana]|uniref:Serine/arginine-rich SC35-like splicing factor SCL28 n=4 Tax=Arabidopsis TaxID=3701 RepID=SRC28_ARATH|nr:SC35-like splicing factor 28 [Arabidopsis thaliana]Q1PDV2.1 RecName: Full=Serine/arginine-rich SC35-like splicing factor SCL28; Short=At-SCL28; Short=AtSCL28; AltName: Full=28 kDa SC35-like splicing factor; AltName: Full=SC35-like splicing factor 28; AltName: Full=Serine/arginine-rich splicing factor 28 [Arabidopsis thaliana]KAG7602745.1 RNA recognition motif domain [Arabidopsis thaliana x Arabidopsis arenosa]KAG7609687.1 RNA recognition motif domain [Arabidopsis suecica]ABE66166.1 28 kDa SC|eukprot:NP_197382.3 SC35-like splicing factor 28 [Arabidopsis thaliana]